jgi:hypothetical protein
LAFGRCLSHHRSDDGVHCSLRSRKYPKGSRIAIDEIAFDNQKVRSPSWRRTPFSQGALESRPRGRSSRCRMTTCGAVDRHEAQDAHNEISPSSSRCFTDLTLECASGSTLDRARSSGPGEVLEEACAVVTRARLLGFCWGACVSGPEHGVVLVRSICAPTSS